MPKLVHRKGCSIISDSSVVAAADLLVQHAIFIFLQKIVKKLSNVFVSCMKKGVGKRTMWAMASMSS